MSEEKPTPTQPQRTEVKTEPASTVQVLPVIVFVLSEDQYRQALAEGSLTDKLMEEIKNAN